MSLNISGAAFLAQASQKSTISKDFDNARTSKVSNEKQAKSSSRDVIHSTRGPSSNVKGVYVSK